jgi:anti-anti-sigma factor
MEITSRIKEGVAVLDLNGRFVVSSGETEVLGLRCAIAALVAEGRVFVALHLAGLASIDARGLGELVMMHTTLRALGGELLLVGATAGVRRMLSVTRLDTVLPLCDSEAEATRSIRRITSSTSYGGPSNESDRPDNPPYFRPFDGLPA